MESFVPTEHVHRCYNPLTDEWVLVSPHRTERPWQGQVERLPGEQRPAHDPTVTNDFAALVPDAPASPPDDPLFRTVPVPGTCRVICFSPRHDLSLSGRR